ncbi:hypothetical protein GOD21_15060 [Sinorhizobium medicae]|nr:hypothetical protein [Sinorhizobium medicae]
MRAAVMTLFSFFMFGCVSAINVQREEVRLYSNSDPSTYEGNLAFAQALAEAYIRLSDQASIAQDAAAMGLITAASVAAGGILYDAHLDLVKGAGLAAGSLTATASYFRPGEAGTHLLEAAEQLLCIQNAGLQFPKQYRPDPEAISVIVSGITTVRVNLRKQLRRSLPDYKDLVNNLKFSLAAQNGSGLGVYPGSIADLRAAVATCVL